MKIATSNSLEEGCSRSKKKQKQLGKYCVAGGPGNVSCKNSYLTEGISMHGFPKGEGKKTNLSTKFVQNSERTGNLLHIRPYVQLTLSLTVLLGVRILL